MLVDALTIPSGITIETEICIIGAGAAGIALAREFADSQFRVAVVESGGLEFEANTQQLYEAQIVADLFS